MIHMKHHALSALLLAGAAFVLQACAEFSEKPVTRPFQAQTPVTQQETTLYQQDEGQWHERYTSAVPDAGHGRVSTSATRTFELLTPVVSSQTDQQPLKSQKGSFVVARATSDNATQALSRRPWSIAIQVPLPLVMEQVALVKLDTGMVLAVPWGRCLPTLGCVATLQLTSYQFEQLRAAGMIELVLVRNANVAPVTVDLPLERLDHALATLDGWAEQSPAVAVPPVLSKPDVAAPSIPSKPKENPLLQKRGRLF